MGDVVELGFPEFLWRSGVRLECRAEFEADPVAWVWRGIDPKLDDSRNWLDAHAPGWTTRVGALSLEELEPPVGRDEVASFLTFDVHAVFRTAAHRDAWRDRRDRIRDEARRLRDLVAERRAAAPEGSSVCGACGETMEAAKRSETARVAQFAFSYDFPVKTCPGCGAFSFRAADLAEISQATEMAASRVGLPDCGSPMWNEEHAKEWRRRRKASPEITLDVTLDMSAEAIIALLDAELARGGRIIGRPPTLA